MGELEEKVAELQAINTRLAEDNKALNNRKSILEKVLTLKEEQIQVLQDGVNVFHSQDGLHSDKAADDSADLKGPDGKIMSGEELVKHWKSYVKALASLLVKVDSGAVEQGLLTEVEKLMTDALSLCRRVAMVNPLAAKVLVSAQYDLDKDPEPVKESHWFEVVKSLSLTQQQREEIQNLSRQFRARMELTVEARKDINAALADSLPDLYSSRGQAARSLKAHGALAKLQEATRSEHRFHFEYMVTVLDQTLSKVQMAQASVQSYPFFPDPLIMASVLDQEDSLAAQHHMPHGMPEVEHAHLDAKPMLPQ